MNRGAILNKKVLIGSIFSSIFGSLISILALYIFIETSTSGLNPNNTLDFLIWCFFAIILSVLISFRAANVLHQKIIKQLKSIDLDNLDKSKITPEIAPLIDVLAAKDEHLSHKIDELEKKHRDQDAMRREFTANVSHELKTPLTSISGYAEIIKDGIAKPEDTQKFASKIYDESQRLITLIGDIIKISKLDENGIEVKPEEIDLYNVCEQTLQHLEKSIIDKGLSVKLSGSHLKIHGVTSLVEETVFNLCDNAIKYNKMNGSIALNIVQCFDGVELSVSDTGIGISQEDIPHIFERFYRADKSHSKEIGGTGLGLSIVKHSAIVLGAQVTVESELGKGTTFRILF